MSPHRPIVAATSITRLVRKHSLLTSREVPPQPRESMSDRMDEINQASNQSKTWTKSMPIVFAPSPNDPLDKTWHPSMPIHFEDTTQRVSASFSAPEMPLTHDDQMSKSFISVPYGAPTSRSPSRVASSHCSTSSNASYVGQPTIDCNDCLFHGPSRPVLTGGKANWAKMLVSEQKRSVWRAPVPPENRIPLSQRSAKPRDMRTTGSGNSIGSRRSGAVAQNPEQGMRKYALAQRKREENKILAQMKEEQRKIDDERRKEKERREEEEWREMKRKDDEEQKEINRKREVDEAIKGTELQLNLIIRKVQVIHAKCQFQTCERVLTNIDQETLPPLKTALNSVRRSVALLRVIRAIALDVIHLEASSVDRYAILLARVKNIVDLSAREHQTRTKLLDQIRALITALDKPLRNCVQDCGTLLFEGSCMIRGARQAISRFNFGHSRELVKGSFMNPLSETDYVNLQAKHHQLCGDINANDAIIEELLYKLADLDCRRLQQLFEDRLTVWQSNLFMESVQWDLHCIRSIKRYRLKWKMTGAESRPLFIELECVAAQTTCRSLEILLESTHCLSERHLQLLRRIKACHLQAIVVFSTLYIVVMTLLKPRDYDPLASSMRRIRRGCVTIDKDVRYLHKKGIRLRQLSLLARYRSILVSALDEIMRERQGHWSHWSAKNIGERFVHGLNTQELDCAMDLLRTREMQRVLSASLRADRQKLKLDPVLLGFSRQTWNRLSGAKTRQMRDYLNTKGEYLDRLVNRLASGRNRETKFHMDNSIEAILKKVFPTKTLKSSRKTLLRNDLKHKRLKAVSYTSKMPIIISGPSKMQTRQRNQSGQTTRRVSITTSRSSATKLSRRLSLGKKSTNILVEPAVSPNRLRVLRSAIYESFSKPSINPAGSNVLNQKKRLLSAEESQMPSQVRKSRSGTILLIRPSAAGKAQIPSIQPNKVETESETAQTGLESASRDLSKPSTRCTLAENELEKPLTAIMAISRDIQESLKRPITIQKDPKKPQIEVESESNKYQKSSIQPVKARNELERSQDGDNSELKKSQKMSIRPARIKKASEKSQSHSSARTHEISRELACPVVPGSPLHALQSKKKDIRLLKESRSGSKSRFISRTPIEEPQTSTTLQPTSGYSISHAFRTTQSLKQLCCSKSLLEECSRCNDASDEGPIAACERVQTGEVEALAQVEAQFGQIQYAFSQETLDKHKAKVADETIYYSHRFYKDEKLTDVPVCYCKTFQRCEDVAGEFLNEKVVGFDLEWRPNATASMGIKNNVSLVQVSSRSRIALFHLALHKGKTAEEIMPPNLRKLVESKDIIKTGVSIQADCTRLKTFFGVEARGLIELSHLHNLVHNKQTANGTIAKRLESLANQVKTYLHMPMAKGDVRVSEWHQPLSFDQCAYAATDAWASLCVFYVLEKERRMMKPEPPMPPFAELKEEIVGARKDIVKSSNQSCGLTETEELSNAEESIGWGSTDDVDTSDDDASDVESSDQDSSEVESSDVDSSYLTSNDVESSDEDARSIHLNDGNSTTSEDLDDEAERRLPAMESRRARWWPF